MNNKGQNNGMSKLTDEEVIEIRNRPKELTHQQIADKFNIGRTCITRILNGKRRVG